MTVELLDEFRGELVAGLGDDVHRSGAVSQQVAGLAAGEELLRPAGDQLEQQLVDAADDLGAGPAQLVAAVDQQPQRDGGVVGHDLPQARAAQPGHGHAVGVDRVGLAALAGVEHPHPRRQLRRHVEHGLAVGDQALGDVPADAGAALHRPDPVRELPAGRQHLLVAVGVGAEAALRQDLLAFVDDSRSWPTACADPSRSPHDPSMSLLARTLWTMARRATLL